MNDKSIIGPIAFMGGALVLMGVSLYGCNIGGPWEKWTDVERTIHEDVSDNRVVLEWLGFPVFPIPKPDNAYADAPVIISITKGNKKVVKIIKVNDRIYQTFSDLGIEDLEVEDRERSR